MASGMGSEDDLQPAKMHYIPAEYECISQELGSATVVEVEGTLSNDRAGDDEPFWVEFEINCYDPKIATPREDTDQDRYIINHWLGVRYGEMLAHLVKRKDIFWEYIGPAQDFAETFYDQESGELKPIYKPGGSSDIGSRWNEEFAEGDFLIIEKIDVEPEYRRKGIGTAMVGALLETVYLRYEAFLCLVSPIDRKTGESDSEFEQRAKEARDFFKFLKFEEVGTTGWLCYSIGDALMIYGLPGEGRYPRPRET